VLGPAVLQRAARAATRAFDHDQVLAAARRLGAPMEEPPVDRLARELVAELAANRSPRAGLRGLLLDGLARAGPSPELEGAGGIADWMSASPEDRGRALRQLLDLGDRLPYSGRGRLRFPPLASAARG
jgi:hypothetical protein